jgi:hypothetical protein
MDKEATIDWQIDELGKYGSQLLFLGVTDNQLVYYETHLMFFEAN